MDKGKKQSAFMPLAALGAITVLVICSMLLIYFLLLKPDAEQPEAIVVIQYSDKEFKYTVKAEGAFSEILHKLNSDKNLQIISGFDFNTGSISDVTQILGKSRGEGQKYLLFVAEPNGAEFDISVHEGALSDVSVAGGCVYYIRLVTVRFNGADIFYELQPFSF